jgi:hypothetical protein
MTMKPRYQAALAAVLSFWLFGSASVAQELNLSNKWRIAFDSTAKSDGKIVFQLTPKGGQPQVVTVPIASGRTENSVAQDVKNGFKAALDKKGFHVEVDDGEDVLVKRRGKTPDFELKLVESTVTNVRINIRKE